MDYNIYSGYGAKKTDGSQRAPTYLSEESEWTENILCLERDTAEHGADLILGGANGIVNAPMQALANRTVYLRNAIQQLASVVKILTLNLSSYMSTIKNLYVATTKPADFTYNAWLSFQGADDPPVPLQHEVVVVTEAQYEGAYTQRLTAPTLRLVCDNGDVFFIRTDGQSVDPNSIGSDPVEP